MRQGHLVAAVASAAVLLLPAIASAAPLEAGLTSNGSPAAGLVLAVAVGLALRMASRARRT